MMLYRKEGRRVKLVIAAKHPREAWCASFFKDKKAAMDKLRPSSDEGEEILELCGKTDDERVDLLVAIIEYSKVEGKWKQRVLFQTTDLRFTQLQKAYHIYVEGEDAGKPGPDIPPP